MGKWTTTRKKKVLAFLIFYILSRPINPWLVVILVVHARVHPEKETGFLAISLIESSYDFPSSHLLLKHLESLLNILHIYI